MKNVFNYELNQTKNYLSSYSDWYSNFVPLKIYNPGFGHKPYGDGTNATFSSIIALGEGWAYYMGHYMADLRYNTAASCQSEQTDADGFAISFCPSGSNHPHLDVEENFNPNLSSDPFKWIPQGLFYDLWDPANELKPSAPVNDNVAGYSNAQMFNAFSNNIYNLQVYKTNLLVTTSNPTSINVSQLFAEYHY